MGNFQMSRRALMHLPTEYESDSSSLAEEEDRSPSSYWDSSDMEGAHQPLQPLVVDSSDEEGAHR